MFPSGYYPMMPSNGGAFSVQQINQNIQASMNTAGPGSNVFALAALDKQQALQHVQAETNYNYTYAWEQQTKGMEKKYWDRRRQAIQQGYLF